MTTYYDDIDELSYEDLEKHCRKHQLDKDIPDEVANATFRKAWEDGHAHGNHEVAIMYVDISEVVNLTWRTAKAQNVS